MTKRTKRKYTRRDGGRHRIVPVWKKEFDLDAYAKALALLALDLDQKSRIAHKKGNESSEGGGNHE